jgi:D-alanine-D-alanine ligase-like ATP-grasp enzyme
MSNEHDVSIASAKNIIKYIDATKYQLILFYCTKGGSFYKLHTIKQREYLQPKQKIPLEEIRNHIDIALPMTHGKYGEDGNLQGIFERYNIPYCGCRML